jgi:hypothetical protein
MSTFVLMGARPFPQPELSATGLAADIERACEFIGSLRRWRLLRCYATGTARADQPRVVLVMRASSQGGAERVAAVWSRLSGFDVTVWPLVVAGPGCGRRAA